MKKFCFVLCLCLTGGFAQAQHNGGNDGGMMDMTCPPNAAPEPILTTSDLNGDGVVNLRDLRLIAKQVQRHRYEAIMDRDADGRLDIFDVILAIWDLGTRSSLFDRQMVALWDATKRYQDVENAIEDGFRPFTQVLHGHGIHYARLPIRFTPSGQLDPTYPNTIDGNLSITQPEGLNYDPDGNLVAVFFIRTIDVRQWIFATDRDPLIQEAMDLVYRGAPPHIFNSADEMWHEHYGACWNGLDYPAMSLDPSIVPIFTQHLTMQECAQYAAETQQTDIPKFGWLPAFNMIHVWLYRLNPCGLFANTLPALAVGYPEEPFPFTFEEWYAKQFGGQQ